MNSLLELFFCEALYDLHGMVGWVAFMDGVGGPDIESRSSLSHYVVRKATELLSLSWDAYLASPKENIKQPIGVTNTSLWTLSKLCDFLVQIGLRLKVDNFGWAGSYPQAEYREMV